MARQSDPLQAIPAGIPVLLTRPEAESLAFAAACATRFGARLCPVVTPLLAPRYLTASVPAKDYAAVVFTSAHGVEGARRLGVALPAHAWCVGRKTATAASAAGFRAISADGDADALISALRANPPNGRILYLRGVDTHGNILERLQSFGLAVDELVVYVQEAQDLTAEAIYLLQARTDVIVPLFSPRTAALFRTALPADRSASLHIAAMSAAVTGPVADLLQAKLVVASRPDADAMLDAVETLLADLPLP
jgi:uroporphyrinogen-III synthase